MTPSPLVRNANVARVANAAAAATTDVDTTVLPADGFESVAWVAAFGTVTNGSQLALEVYGSNQANGSSPVLLAATPTVTASGASNQIMAVEVRSAPFPFLFCRVKRGTQPAAVDAVVCVRHQARVGPGTTTHATQAAAPSAFTGPGLDPVTNRLPAV